MVPSAEVSEESHLCSELVSQWSFVYLQSSKLHFVPEPAHKIYHLIVFFFSFEVTFLQTSFKNFIIIFSINGG